MNRTGLRILSVLGVVLAVVIVISGCASAPPATVESWTHVLAEENYREAEGYLIYTYRDERFKTGDWYDVWMDDSHWEPDSGWSRFVDIFDGEKGLFMYGLSFFDGYIEFPAYGKELVGATLRFYRMPVK